MRFLLILIFTGLITFSQAQHLHQNEPCGTMIQDSISRLRFPERGTLEDMENAIQRKVKEIRLRRAQGRILAGVINIPIVVHVVHNGEPVGTGTNISQAQVQAQIEVLNEDFRRKPGTPGYNNNPVGADIEIEFCLSPVDENGNLLDEPGIDRVDGNRPDWSEDAIAEMKPNTIWNPNMFYNIWTVKFDASAANLIGYAQFPDDSGLPGMPNDGGAAGTDGVVIRYQSFGSVDKGTFPVMVAPYNKGRTLSHETGHWLGLRHIWGDGGCDATDYVDDTPSANGPTSGCPVGRTSCGVTNMIANYMDYSNDACMNIFTQGQKDRMLAVMELSPRRKTLILANLCSPIIADKPNPNFTVDNQLVLLGGEATFNDLSTNFPNTWKWTFEGGDPGTSNVRDPKVTYTVPGTYKVTLIVSNALGADTLEIDDYITVSESGVCGSNSNFKDSYTPSTIPLSNFGPYTGYLTGHNSQGTKAISEYFTNELGYKYVSGVNLKFSEATVTDEEAAVIVTIWNARGPQGSPGSVVERKTVLLKQIEDDIDNDRPTTIVFDRETPVFGKPYHIGVELTYGDGYTVAVESSANGEATTPTSWQQNSAGVWKTYTIALGANIAMNIEPMVGMKPSVQVSASSLLIYPGEKVTLNGRGASVFVWHATDGSIENVAGPQLIVYPPQESTYLTVGSGLDLCEDSVYTTIYVRDNVLGEEDPSTNGINIYPNPGTTQLHFQIENEFRGPVSFRLLSAVGNEASAPVTVQKSERKLQYDFNTTSLAPGVYIAQVSMEGKLVMKKWVRR